MAHYIMKMRDDHYSIIGPFPDLDTLSNWGRADQADGGDDPRWQSIELDNPHAAPVVIAP